MKKYFPFVFLIGISFLATFPLLKPGLPPTHDGEYHVVRGYQFFKVLKGGVVYPRWQPDTNNGYGSPLMNYYYPLPYYVMSFFHILNFSFIDSFKLGMVAAAIAGAIFFFLWSRIFFGTIGGIVSSVCYTFSPYHFVDIYVRGSAGEVWSLAFFPGFFWAATKAIRENNLKYTILASIFLALVVFAHNILAYMFFPFAFFYCIFLLFFEKNKIQAFMNTGILFLLGLGLSAIFWIPALLERSYVTGLLIFNITEHFPQVYQLVFPSWGTGFSSTDVGNQMSFQIGLTNILGVVLGMFVLLYHLRKKDSSHASIILFFLLAFFVVLFLVLKVSYPIWKYVPLFNYFQFPWRFLSLEILFSSFLLGTVFIVKRSRVLAVILILLTSLLTINYTKPAYYLMRDDNYYTTRSNFIDGTNTPGDIFNTVWFNTTLPKAKEKIVIAAGEGEIQKILLKPTEYSFSIDVRKLSEVQINTAYFPGWTAYINKQEIILDKTKDGFMRLTLPAGNHKIVIKQELTMIQSIATRVSSISILLVLALFARMSYATMRR